ncbi:MAG: hypothetical protein EBZ67_02765 [Chitinophagia bacterium]|nr:hypothetical protein [Chitinophagia bacterium]
MAQMKIGDNARTLNPDAILEMESGNKGLILPRVSLRSTSVSDPLRTFTVGMMVYNTSTANNVSPGIYVSDGVRWIKASENATIPDSASGQNVFWSLRGNASVTASHFLGSINAAPVIIKTGNAERLRVSENGWVGVGTASPRAALHLKGQLVIDSIGVGNAATDKWLVANPADGRVKLLSNAPFMTGTQSILLTVGANGQILFQTPAAITDPNRIFLYRNGVMISFSVNNGNSIISEIPCMAGDQVRIIQLL